MIEAVAHPATQLPVQERTTRSSHRHRPITPSDDRSRLATFISTTILGLGVVLFLLGASRPSEIVFLGFQVDRVTSLLGLLVAGVSFAVVNYSERAVDQRRGQAAFDVQLALTAGCSFALMFANNLMILMATWFMTSLGLHSLLTYHRERPAAHQAARLKFVISRLGDVALLAVIGLLYFSAGTLDLNKIISLANADHLQNTGVIASLVVFAAITKSAQFPFHTWLPDTLESPTPVSALMHAGIINGGGVLLIKFGPLISQVPIAMSFLVVLGSISVAIGTLSAWAQPTTKRALAWSTVAQMGFMMVECGLGLFDAALIHIVAHGLYKSYAFLNSATSKNSHFTPRAETHLMKQFAKEMGLCAWFASCLLASYWLLSPHHEVKAALGVLIVSTALSMALGAASRLLGLSLLSLAIPVAYHLTEGYFTNLKGIHSSTSDGLLWLLPATTLFALAFAYRWSSKNQAWKIHARHGFYLGTRVLQCLNYVWPTSAQGVAK